jgi:transcriptional regulator with XRE-family HTH domain
MNEHEFGAKIKARREELGLSQNDIAMALRIDQGKVSLIEKGLRRVDVVKELPLLAKVLQKSVSWFFEGSEAPAEVSPAEALIREYFPDVTFTEFEIKRLERFLEPVVKVFYENSDMSKAAQG